jgi:CheY-like chemotaxis protein
MPERDAPEGVAGRSEANQFHKVLVVDDITYVLKSISRVLREEGFFVMTATTAQEAITSFQSYWPDLVTIDQKLPDMSGFQLAKQIRKMDPLGATKIIFISSVYEKEEIRKILQEGVDDYLMKPFKKARLIETVKQVLGMTEKREGLSE